jgi:WD40 repeat protein
MDDRKRKLFYGTSKGKLKAINMKNGAVGRKFKKERGSSKNKFANEENKEGKKLAQDISCIHYYSDFDREDPEAVLIASSWDRRVRFYDDTQGGDEPLLPRHEEKKHSDACNFVDFRQEDMITASCGDDGVIHMFNYQSRRPEGQMENISEKDGAHVPLKVCMFIKNTDLLVTSDLEGYLKFWCVTMSPHPFKN